MKLKPYQKYKDSGIEWLGEVPEGWEVIKLRNTINYKKGKNPTVLFENNVNNQYLPYLSMDYLRNNEDKIHFVEKSIDTVIANEGDILLLWDGSNAGEFIVSKNGAVSSTMAKIFPEIKLDKRFCFFLCKTIEPILREHTIGMGIPHVNANILKNIVCPFPSKNEQTIIATFLDNKTAKIDELIKKNERLIELLEEKRQAIISHTVTKGIKNSPSPSSPPIKGGEFPSPLVGEGKGEGNLKMKDSGIEWIGEIPEGWKIKRIKHIAKEKFKNGIFKKKDFYGSGVKLINVFDVYRQNFYIDLNSLDHIEATKKEVKIYSVEAGDILFVRSSLKLEGVGASVCVPYINEPLIFECHLVKMQPSFEIVPEYLINFLNANVVRQRFIALANTVTMATLGQSSLSTLEVELPPILEQLAIVDYLKRETTKIDRVINKIQSQIETLKEYRQALISNVVTGKVRIYEDQ